MQVMRLRFISNMASLFRETAGDVKLIDYGISCEVDHVLAKRHTSVGTPYWMAPEVILCDENQCHEYDARYDPGPTL
jgi:serine/threonine protein kinase